MPVGALSRAAAEAVGAEGVSREGIWERLAKVPDGRVYPLPVLAAIWLCTVTAAGHVRVAAVTEWLQATTWQERVRLRLPWNPWDGHLLPDEATIRRFLNEVDDQALAVALLDPPLADIPADLADVETTGTSMTGAARLADAEVRPPVPGEAAPVRAYALDGKTSRGARRPGGGLVHLLGVAAHGEGRLVGQREVDAKSNETTAFRALLAPLELTGAFVSFDALHTVRSNLAWLVTRKNAHYFAVSKRNQPTLRAFLAALPWAQIPTADTTLTTATATAGTRPAPSRSPPSTTSTSRTPPRQSRSSAGAERKARRPAARPSTRSPTPPPSRPAPHSWPTSPEASGTSRSSSTTSAT